MNGDVALDRLTARWRQAMTLPAALFAAVLLFGCAEQEVASESPRPPLEARVAVDKAVATTGDVITYSVEIETAPGLEAEMPEPGADIAGFRIIDLGRDPERSRGERTISRRWYRLRADLVGSYILPPIEVTATSEDGTMQSIETSEIFVEVQSVLPADGAAQDIRDVKPLRDPPPSPIWPWVLMAAAVLVLVGLWLWWRRRRRRAEIERRVPPHELAYQELDRLRRTDFEDLAQLREYYFQISEVLRRYVEGRWGLNATDLTTEEILPRLVDLQGLDADQEQGFEQFLHATDRVKYAAQVPQEREIEETYELALGFVESTAWAPANDEGNEADRAPSAAGSGAEPGSGRLQELRDSDRDSATEAIAEPEGEASAAGDDSPQQRKAGGAL